MGIKTIDGATFKNIIIGGGINLKNNKNLIDSLNVFPVPDGDTGTNMSLTYAQAVAEMKVAEDKLSSVCSAFAKGALKGARGNSGVILSQIIKGLCEVLSKCDNITTKDFSEGLKRGTEIAYSAVTKPKEGTILTVIRVIAENSAKFSSIHSNFDEFLSKLLAKGEEILAKTPDMLAVLKKAGTVDAGGKGLVEIVRGMYNALVGIPMVEKDFDVTENTADEASMLPDISDLGEIEFGYCTEFFVINLNKTTTLSDIDKLRDKLCEIGDSALCIGDLSMVKIHVHTNNPGVALQYALQIGEIDKLKIENMREQNRQLIAKRAPKKKKELSMISICNGDGIKSMFHDLGVEYIIDGGQSMNPSVTDILQAINLSHSDNVIIFPNNKNIIMATNQAKEIAECNVFIVPTRNITQGLKAAMSFNGELSPEENANIMTTSYKSLVCGEITYAVKNTNINDLDIKEGDIIGMDSKDILNKGIDLESATIKLLEILRAEDKSSIVMYYGNGLTEQDVGKICDSVAENFANAEVIPIFGGQQHYYFLISLE